MNKYFPVFPGLCSEFALTECLVFGMVISLNAWAYKHPERAAAYYVDGRYWQRATCEDIAAKCHISLRTVKSAVKHLVEKGYLIKGCHNRKPRDRTQWLSIGPAGQPYLHAVMAEKATQKSEADHPQKDCCESPSSADVKKAAYEAKRRRYAELGLSELLID